MDDRELEFDCNWSVANSEIDVSEKIACPDELHEEFVNCVADVSR